MSLSVRLLTRAGNVLAVLPEAFDVRYSRRPLSATEVTLSVPRDTPGLEHAVRGNLLEVWRPGAEDPEASGRLELRDVSPGVITLTAYTEEILLKDLRTPAAYGTVFAGMDVADVARACLDGWHSQRVKTAAEWAKGALSQVEAIDAAGGSLWLARNAQGQYQRSGHAIFTFKASDVPGFKRWDRIRWSSDWPPEGLVYTTIQYALSGSATPPTAASTSWLPNVSFPSESEESQTLRGERGVLPDELGLDLGGATGAYLHVICRLYTDDQVSQDEGETATSGSSPRFFALEALARTDTGLQEGSIPASTGVTVQAVNADAAPSFDVVRDACEQADLDFQVVQGRLSIAESFGPSLTGTVNLVTSDGRAGLDAPSGLEIVTFGGVPVTFEGEYVVFRVEES